LLDTESGEQEDWHHEVRESTKMSNRADGSYSKTWRGISKIILRPTIRAMMKHDWQGQDNILPSGGMIIAANHLSYADVLAMALFVDQAGRYPTYLAKSSLFKIKLLGPIIVKLGQLPVYRGQSDAALVLRDAEQGVRDGACVIFYPESTVTRDPAMWPMVSKTGVARLALATGAPVIPVAHWGAQDVLPYGTIRLHAIPRRTVRVLAGPPVDLSEFEGKPLDNKTLRAATDKIMADVAALLGKLRGEDPPAEPYHPAVERRKVRAGMRQLAAEQSGADQGDADEGSASVAGSGAEQDAAGQVAEGNASPEDPPS
jgi:1-acyl-sn-glycerol-3-phosphate acyltransferase